MLTIRNHRVSIMILYAIALHLTWSVALFFDENAAMATAVASIRYIVPRPFGMLALLFVSFLAIAGLCISNGWRAVALMLPQQFVLFISAGGAWEAMWEGHFADGVIRPTAFIVADQAPAILAAVGHSLAILAMATDIWRGK